MNNVALELRWDPTLLELCKDQGRKEAGDELPVKKKLFFKRSKSEMMISSEVGDELLFNSSQSH